MQQSCIVTHSVKMLLALQQFYGGINSFNNEFVEDYYIAKMF